MTLVLHVSIDGILGAIIALFIIKTSISVLREASNEIIGSIQIQVSADLTAAEIHAS